MKKLKKIFMNNLKLLIGIIIGTVVSGVIVYAATLVASSEVSYTLNGQSTVKGALDDLYTKAQNSGDDSNSIDFTTLATSTNKRVLASKNGVCIKRNNKVSCFKINNWAEEQNHIQQVFSDGSCIDYSDYMYCYASDYSCSVFSYGDVKCYGHSDYKGCDVMSDGSIHCY